MIQYDMHQYIMISNIQYEITCTYLYLYQMYDTIYETKEIKIEISKPTNVIHNYINVCYNYRSVDYLLILLINIYV